MAIWSRLGLSGQAAGAGAAVVVLIIGGIYLVTQRRDPPPPEPSPPSAQEAAAAEIVDAVRSEPEAAQEEIVAEPAAPEPEPEPEAKVEVEAATARQAAPEPEPAEEPATVAEADPPEAATIEPPTPPSFDVVQVAPDGGGVIAGSATPGSDVVFLLDGAEVARGKADGAGKFGVLLDFPASDTPRALSIVTELADGRKVTSEGTILISPVRTASAEPAPEIAPQPETAPEVEVAENTETDGEGPRQSDTPEPPQSAQNDVPDDTPAPQAQQPAPQDTPAVVLADNTGVTVLQPAPQPASPKAQADAPVTANVVIDTISYDAEGEVALAGRGASQGFVRVYLNDKPVKTTRIAENGAWQAPLPDIDAGVYRLRVDEVDESGIVTSRVETPFQREAPEVATATPQTATAVTVQPGFTLWAIARDRFGAGEQYVRVYEANRDLIRDPDLIYPGQVFALPEG
ncbi:hypothetical protein SAMN04488002_2154 [Litoreibacter janthinus]|uniref:LysM domain-containing protein n=2 Tax=Litoreibacter janthinus TaxID=670154 RepID=A0A1I6GYD9_9RHOB|nr:hypothetical protein SAMN04488002_2154 [Litoreibacter janthinus]